jgi:3-oxosteroid 1-dehydrogenase
MSWDETYDLVIAGSGGGSVVASLVAKRAGKTAIILEKQAKFGGSTSYSGGVLWVPCNYLLKGQDSSAEARRYMDNLIGDVGPASSPARREAYLRDAPRTVDFLVSHGLELMDAGYPDYYHGQVPGSLGFGRAILPPLFDIDQLGEWAERLGCFEGWPALPISSHEMAALQVAKRTWKGRTTAARIALRMLREKLTGKRLRGSGNSLQGRLLQIALREKIPLSMETEVIDLVVEGDRVAGVIVKRKGRTVRIGARDGVLLNTGGFSHNEAMRQQFQRAPASTRWTASNPGDTGDGIRLGMALGAAVDLMEQAWWTPGSMAPDGKIAGFHCPGDAAKPHMIVVDKAGKRFANEANSYMEFGNRMYEQGAVPAYGILDARHRAHYPLGMLLPGITPEEPVRSGYLKRADTLAELARQCGVDPAGLEETARRFNGFCRAGQDRDFHRGDFAYNRYFGDSSVHPNPCLGTLEQAPFFAIEIWPNDVGTAGGLLTDEHARVLRTDGSVIAGLYATGNCTASVMGRAYPGAGASIAAAFTFGYIAAHHAAQGGRVNLHQAA